MPSHASPGNPAYTDRRVDAVGLRIGDDGATMAPDADQGQLFSLDPDQSDPSRSPLAGPLATRMRPSSLDEYVGQEHLIGPGRALRRAIEEDRVHSMILWGPPGSG